MAQEQDSQINGTIPLYEQEISLLHQERVANDEYNEELDVAIWNLIKAYQNETKATQQQSQILATPHTQNALHEATDKLTTAIIARHLCEYHLIKAREL